MHLYKASAGETVEFDGVGANYLVPNILWQMSQLVLDERLGVGPDTVRMRKIRSPHDVVFAKEIEEPCPHAIRLVRSIVLPMPVIGRFHL